MDVNSAFESQERHFKNFNNIMTIVCNHLNQALSKLVKIFDLQGPVSQNPISANPGLTL